MRPLRRISLPITTPRRNTRPTRTVAGATLAVEIAAAVAVAAGDVAADVVVADARRAAAIFRPPSTPRHKAGTSGGIRAVMTLAAMIHAVMNSAGRGALINATIAGRRALATPVPQLRRILVKSRFCFRANRSRNIAANRQRQLQRPSLKHKNVTLNPKRRAPGRKSPLVLVRQVFPAGLPVACLVGSWPSLGPN